MGVEQGGSGQPKEEAGAIEMRDQEEEARKNAIIHAHEAAQRYLDEGAKPALAAAKFLDVLEIHRQLLPMDRNLAGPLIVSGKATKEDVEEFINGYPELE